MNIKEAIGVYAQVANKVVGTRQEHQMIAESIKTISEYVESHEKPKDKKQP